MTAPLRIALAQINAVLGDIAGNEGRIADQITAARDAGAQLVCFPELALTGYPPEDLLLKEHFLADARAALERLHAGHARNRRARRVSRARRGRPQLRRGARRRRGPGELPQASPAQLRRLRRGALLPARQRGATIEVDGVTVGLTICEDIWQPGPPLSDEALAGARVIVNLSASPYHAGKGARARADDRRSARTTSSRAVAFCALVGGQDELVFDGHSVVVDHEGVVLARAPQFDEALLIADVDPVAAGSARLRDTRRRAPAAAARGRDRPARLVRGRATRRGSTRRSATRDRAAASIEEEVYGALVLGTRDYVAKNGFEHVVLGLSGGDRLDARRADRRRRARRRPRDVRDDALAVLLAGHAQDDAHALAANLGIELLELPIEPMMRAFDSALGRASSTGASPT